MAKVRLIIIIVTYFAAYNLLLRQLVTSCHFLQDFV